MHLTHSRRNKCCDWTKPHGLRNGQIFVDFKTRECIQCTFYTWDWSFWRFSVMNWTKWAGAIIHKVDLKGDCVVHFRINSSKLDGYIIFLRCVIRYYFQGFLENNRKKKSWKPPLKGSHAYSEINPQNTYCPPRLI